MATLQMAIDSYLNNVLLARSANTARTYKNGMTLFRQVLADRKIDLKSLPVEQLPEDAIAWFADELKGSAPTTERLYLTVAAGFFAYVSAEALAPVNLARLRL